MPLKKVSSNSGAVQFDAQEHDRSTAYGQNTEHTSKEHLRHPHRTHREPT